MAVERREVVVYVAGIREVNGRVAYCEVSGRNVAGPAFQIWQGGEQAAGIRIARHFVSGRARVVDGLCACLAAPQVVIAGRIPVYVVYGIEYGGICNRRRKRIGAGYVVERSTCNTYGALGTEALHTGDRVFAAPLVQEAKTGSVYAAGCGGERAEVTVHHKGGGNLVRAGLNGA